MGRVVLYNVVQFSRSRTRVGGEDMSAGFRKSLLKEGGIDGVVLKRVADGKEGLLRGKSGCKGLCCGKQKGCLVGL